MFTGAFILYVTLGLWFSQWIADASYVPPQAAKVQQDDARLHDAILSLAETIARASSEYGSIHQVDGLESLGKNLANKVQRIRVAQLPATNAKRQEQQNDTLDQAANSTGGLGNLFEQALKGLADNLTSSLATPAYFVGIGLGMGAETALNITDRTKAQAIASQAASAVGTKPTGLNLVAQNLGSGLSAQIAPTFDNIFKNFPVAMAAYALAQGIGQGSANGLNLTQEKFEPNSNSDYKSIARNIGLGISGPITENINTNPFLRSSGLGGGDIMAQLPDIAKAAGQGLGQGASKGLGLSTNGTGTQVTKRQTQSDANQSVLSGAVEQFTAGLSESFLQTADLSKVIDPASLGLDMGATGILSYAAGAGKGFGEGLGIGLNLTSASNSTIVSPKTGGTGMNATQEHIAEVLVRGLVAGFLQNGGAAAAGKQINSTMKELDRAKVAEGAGRGLIEGAIYGVSQAGGLRNVISANFSENLPGNLPSLPPTTFNDSVNGSSVSFIRGLSSEGVLLFAKYMNAGKNASTAPPSRRSVDAKGVVVRRHLMRRDKTSDGSDAAKPATLQGIAQSGIDTLTCSGVGGIAAVAIGIMDVSTLQKNLAGMKESSPLLNNMTLAGAPTDAITIESEGNSFFINMEEGVFRINGLEPKPFAILTGVHVLLTTLAFFFILPIYLIMGAVMRISVMINIPYNEVNNKQWRRFLLLYLFTPLALGGIILGMVAMGNSQHFRTPHGIIGLVLLLITIPTVVVSFFRLRTPAVPPPPSAFHSIKQGIALLKGPQKVHLYSGILVQITLGLSMGCWIEGWEDLRSISLCVADAILTASVMVKITNLLVIIMMGSMAIFALRHFLEVRIAKMESRVGKGSYTLNYGNEKGSAPKPVKRTKRTNSIQTFGFDNATSLSLPSRKTADYLGREDSQIGWPSDVRRYGEDDTIPVRVPSLREYPDNNTLATFDTRKYNEKLGGYEDDRSPIFPPPPPVGLASQPPSAGVGAFEYDRSPMFLLAPPPPVGLASQPPSAYGLGPGDFRSSSVYDMKSSVVSTAVAVQPQRFNGQSTRQVTTGSRKTKESFSRPFENEEEEEWFGMGKGEEKWLKEFGAFRRN